MTARTGAFVVFAAAWVAMAILAGARFWNLVA